jgi:hypothetical protein
MKIQGLDCLEITPISSGHLYQSGKRAEENKTYSRFRYNGIVFTIEDDSPFIALHKQGKLARVTFIEGTRKVESVNEETGDVETTEVPTLTFDSCISTEQEMNHKRHSVALSALDRIATEPISEEMLSTLIAE